MAKKDQKEPMQEQEIQEQEMENVEQEQASTDGDRRAVEELEALQQELVECQAKAEEYLDGWQRSRAEFMNYKKRVEREQAQTYQLAAGNILRRYLDIMDDLERALKNRPQEGEGAAWADGIDLIARKLLSYMESEGVTQMEAEGKEFDPNLHEAVTSEESDEYESGQVIEVIKQGYMIGDRVLRPAMVRVAR